MKKIRIKKIHASLISIFILSLLSTVLAVNLYKHIKKSELIYKGIRLPVKNEDQKAYIIAQAKECQYLPKNGTDRYQCLHSLGKILADQIPFKKIVISLGSSGSDCHDLMHNVVNAEYKRGAKIPDIWQQCTTACFGACYHGGLEGLLSSEDIAKKDDVEVRKSLMKICDSIKDKYNTIYYQCFHGMGHAFMLLEEGDLPKSLHICDGFEKSAWQKHCYEGVFMENLPNTTTFIHTLNYIKHDDPLYPCNSIDKKYQASCYTFQVSYLSSSLGSDANKLIALCGILPEEYKQNCFKQIGLRNINYRSADQSKAQKICEAMPEGDARESCIGGVIASYRDRFPGSFTEMKNKGIFEFCAGVQIEYRLGCYSEIGEVLKNVILNPKLRDKECKSIRNPQYLLNCMRGTKT